MKVFIWFLNCSQGASGSNAYIASQGPLPNTVNDFWRMVVECEVQVIVMACNEQVNKKIGLAISLKKILGLRLIWIG